MLEHKIGVLLYVEKCCRDIYKKNSLLALVLSSEHNFVIFSRVFVGGRCDVLL
jgi:hypothetical protein